jgi:hypothetical protein
MEVDILASGGLVTKRLDILVGAPSKGPPPALTINFDTPHILQGNSNKDIRLRAHSCV